jgi:hypothetical protein
MAKKKKMPVAKLIKLVDEVSDLGVQDIYYDPSFDRECDPHELDHNGRSGTTRTVDKFQNKLFSLTWEVKQLLEFIHQHPEIEKQYLNLKLQ